MRRTGSTILYSPSDLTEFMESRFASWMSRLALSHPDRIPLLEPDPPADPDLSDIDQILADHGIAHERAVVEALRRDGRDLTEIPASPDATPQTLAALRAGAEILYQASLEHPPFAGIPDFLVRVDRPTGLGAYGYEVWDAKLARRARPYFLVQLCAYAEMLEAVQGWRPDPIRVVLGTRETRSFRTDDFFYLYRALRSAFLEFMQRFDPARPPLPEKGAAHRRWAAHAERVLEERDHVSRVANISRGQICRLGEHGVDTLAGLSETTLESVPRMQDRTFVRLRDQAQLQRASEGLDRPRYRVLDPDPDERRKGLALLPPPSSLDVFFDIEGYPLVEGGLEYLFGVATLEDGAPRYRDWWAHDDPQEKRIFEEFVDWVSERRRLDPSLHVYHYAPYEVTALRRLMGRYGTREEEMDALLRGQVFVDLYAVVRGGVRVGEPTYSIKNLERLYLEERRAEVASGMDSVAYYEAWIGGGESPDWRASRWLREIRRYNEEDCVSTLRLTDWLRERQREAAIAYLAPPGEEEVPEAEPVNERALAQRELAERMLAGIPDDPAERSKDPDRWRIQELLAHLVEFHRREMRPVFWALYHRCDLSEEERVEDLDCLAGVERTGASFPIRRSRGFEVRFDRDQDTKIRQGDTCRVAQIPALSVTIEELDPQQGTAVLKVGPSGLALLEDGELPDRLCLVLHAYIGTDKLADAIAEIARSWLDEGTLPPALESTLLRQPPRIEPPKGGPRVRDGGPLVREGEDLSAAIVRLTGSLDASTLCIQGPPGAGKTHNAAQAILALLAGGKRVGVSSNSHKAILNLMTACAEKSDWRLRCMKVGGENDEPFFDRCDGARHVGSGAKAVDALGTHPLVGGTAWAFAHPSFAGALDTLFIDEAGQVSVANLVAMSRCAKSLVLVGDQMQLGQPIQGSHPGESGLSTLDYLLEDHATIPAEQGVFLDRTWRLHPEICRFISGAVYEGRLAPRPENANRVVKLPGGGGRRIRREAGLVFVPVQHDGNAQASDEEVAVVREIVHELRGREVTNERGELRSTPLALEDILVVAPYNMQVRQLQQELGPDARVGSVDKFQGQEAPVVIVSMCASDAGSAPRGVEFLLNRNRINVAISRAQSLAIVVASPALALTPGSSIGQMELVNLFCRVVEDGSTE